GWAARHALAEAGPPPPGALSNRRRRGLLASSPATAHEPSRRLADELHALRREESRLVNPIPEAMVMRELPRPKPAFVLKRGAYDAPGAAVSSGTPAALPPFPADQPRNRLGLARSLLPPQPPLPARRPGDPALAD